jgi:hypothetical protein
MGKRPIIVRDPRPPRTRLLTLVLVVVAVVVVLGFVLFRLRAG